MNDIIIAINKRTRFDNVKTEYVIFKHIIVIFNDDVKIECELQSWVFSTYKTNKDGVILVDNVISVSEKLQDCFDEASKLGLIFY